MRPSAGVRRFLIAALLVGSVPFIGCVERRQDFDLIIRDGTIYDGSGAPDGVRRADVGIRGDRIVAIGDLSKQLSGAQIDADGKAVTPGFVEPRGQSAEALLVDGFAEGRIRQGVTTELLGEGATGIWAEPGAFFDRLEAHGVSLNVGALVPQSVARERGGAAWVRPLLSAYALGVVADDGPPEAWATGHAVVVPLRDSADVGATIGAAVGALPGTTGSIVFSEAAEADPGDGSRVQRVLQGVAIAHQRGLRVGALVTPFTGLVDTISRPVRDALTSGSVGVGSNSASSPKADAPLAMRLAAVGAFPRLFRWAREERGVEFVEAVRRVTALPASLFGLEGRGTLKEGNIADIVVSDPLKIGDRASASAPDTYATGVDYVVVNGVIVLTPDGLTGARPGRRVSPSRPREAR